MSTTRSPLRRCPACGSRLRGRGARCTVCGASVPWHLAPGRVVWGSASFVAAALVLIGGLLWWRGADRGIRPVDQAAVAGVLDAAPTAPPTASPAPAASATRPPNSPFPPTATPLPAMIDYVVQSGDTMFAIAFKYNVTLDDILGANEGTLRDVNSLSLGQVLRIPLRGIDGEPAAEPAADAGAEAGDATESSRAQVDASTGEAEGDVAQAEVADVPPVPAEPDATPLPAGEPIVVEEALTYAVDRGDTLGRIAAEYGVTVEELVRNNELDGPAALLSVGQTIVVAPAVVVTTTPAPTAPPTPWVFSSLDEGGVGASLPSEDGLIPDVFPAPLPLAPQDGRRRVDDVLALRWASSGALPLGAFYVVAWRDAADPESEIHTLWQRNGGNALRLPARLRPARGTERTIDWSVSVRRERSGLLGDDAGVLLSEPPTWWRFTWAPGAVAEITTPTVEGGPNAVPTQPGGSQSPPSAGDVDQDQSSEIGGSPTPSP